MNRIVFFFLLFVPSLLLGQLEYNYFPKEPKSPPASLKQKITTRFDADLVRVAKYPKPIRKGISEIYETRHESTLERLDQEEFLFDDIIYPYCRQVLDKILAANPELPKDEINFLISRSPSPNATCLGEGSIVINLGLLNRLENEGQLAFAICHEIAHYTDNHVDDNILDYIERINSEAYKKEIRKIQDQEYNRNAQAIELLKQNTYQTNRHSRLKESEADSIGLEFYLRTSYDPVEAIRLMAILDKIDEPKFPENIDFKQHFGSLSYTYKDYWEAYDIENSFFYSKKHVFDWDSDSLKTHPQCQDRLRLLANQLANSQSESPSISDAEIQATDKFRQLCDFELIQSSYRSGNFGLGLFQSLQLLNEFPKNTYLHAMVGYSLYQIYMHKKNHKLGIILEMTGPKNKENYDRFLHFTRELRLKEIAQLSFAYLDKGEEVWKEDPFYLYAYILTASISGKTEIGENLRNQYLDKFPEGIFSEEINELTFTQ